MYYHEIWWTDFRDCHVDGFTYITYS